MPHISNVQAAWIAFAALTPVALSLLFSAFQTRQRMAARKAVIDKFTSAEDFATFLLSPVGQRFVSDLANPEIPGRAVIGAVQKGIILLALGGGVCYVGATYHGLEEIVGIGVLLLCLSVGFLVSAGVSYRLSKSLGLTDRTERGAGLAEN